MKMHLTRRACLTAALGPAAVAWPFGGLAGAAAPTAHDLVWTDEARQRKLPFLMRWPDGDAPCAIVLHSHGLGGNRRGGVAWGTAWQDAGFAVLHLQHPGSDSDIFRGGEGSLRAAVSAEQWIARAADVRFVIDELTRQQRSGSARWQRLRLDALGLSGHSFGAGTTLAVAGQRYPNSADVSDPRPRAFITFSPAPGRSSLSNQSLAAQFGGIRRPLFVLTGSRDGDPLDGGRDPGRISGDYRASVFNGLPVGARALLWLDGADHMTFGGGRPGDGDGDARFLSRFVKVQRDRQTAELEPAHHALIRRTSVLWWRAQLLDDAAAAAALRGPAVHDTLAAGDRWTID